MSKPPPDAPAPTAEERRARRMRQLEEMLEINARVVGHIERRIVELRAAGNQDEHTLAKLERSVERLKRGGRQTLALRDKFLRDDARDEAAANREAEVARRERLARPSTRTLIRQALIRRALKERAGATLH